jgi:hypothetical protein
MLVQSSNGKRLRGEQQYKNKLPRLEDRILQRGGAGQEIARTMKTNK